ncbi:MAG: radical SAM protein [Clostridia bacterium]|nr:radical SAM protein [Clostridia bacterium]
MKLKDYLKTCNEVCSTTFDPKTPGVVRLHLVPPKKPTVRSPWVVIINGYSVVPLQSSWAVLLKEFMASLNKRNHATLSDDDISDVIGETVISVKKVFPRAEDDDLRRDLIDLISVFKDLAFGFEPSVEIGYMTLAKYEKYMTAPHRVDLMLSAMEKNGCWNCNQKCLHCYASGEKMSCVDELKTDEWKKIIDKLKEANIPAITFTGGEATIREDLVELVAYSKWFVTRLNTNGILLTPELSRRLYEADLDSVQVTLYSSDEETHNKLVGGNHFRETVRGIMNAIDAGLDVSVNTPLRSLNKNYVDTVKFAKDLGVKYLSCSGLIPAGNAVTEVSACTKLTKEEITASVKEGFNFAKNNDMEISFTSPGWIDEEELDKMHIVVPSCGACLSNMAVAPNGDVIPCQSWLNGDVLGNMLTDKWKDIWNSPLCADIRRRAVKNKQVCLLKEKTK